MIFLLCFIFLSKNVFTFFKIRGGAFIMNNVVTFKILKYEQIKKRKITLNYNTFLKKNSFLMIFCYALYFCLKMSLLLAIL